MKKLIKNIFDFLGFEIKRKYYNDDIKLLTFDEIYKLKIKKEKPVIFDIGANRGQSIERFLKINKYSIIHSFEPNIEDLDYIRKNYGNFENIKLNNFALGKEKTRKEFARLVS